MAKDFTFKQFHINAFQCGMPVSTDAVLLGAWANITKVKTILDIGCGTGLLAIMCAQRNQTAQITAVEIEHNAFNAATQNSLNSLWSSRLCVKHIAIQDFVSTAVTVDAIICNPPYFNSGEQSQTSQRAVARHTSSLSHQNLLSYCDRLLNEKGTASFILPKQEGLMFIHLLEGMQLNGSVCLTLSRLTYVKTTFNKLANRVLIELTKSALSKQLMARNLITKQAKAIDVDKNELTIHDGSGYSADFISLTKDFYLKM